MNLFASSVIYDAIAAKGRWIFVILLTLFHLETEIILELVCYRRLRNACLVCNQLDIF